MATVWGGVAAAWGLGGMAAVHGRDRRGGNGSEGPALHRSRILKSLSYWHPSDYALASTLSLPAQAAPGREHDDGHRDRVLGRHQGQQEAGGRHGGGLHQPGRGRHALDGVQLSDAPHRRERWDMSREGRVCLPLIREQGRGFGFGGRSFKPPAGDYLPAWRSAYRTITGRCVAHQERIFPILTLACPCSGHAPSSQSLPPSLTALDA